MKTAPFRITMIAILTLATLAASEPLRAEKTLVVNIPFAFTAGGIALPAGEYRVERTAYDTPALRIEGTDKGAAAFVLSFAAEAKASEAQPKLVFHCYGNRYFLFQVWTGGAERGRQLPKSPQEKEQSLAAQGETPDQVTIVARLEVPKP